MMLDHMKALFSGHVSGVSCFCGVKDAKVKPFVSDAYLSIVATATHWVCATKIAFAFSVGRLIEHVVGKRNVSQVAPAVVVPDPVDVVNCVGGEFTRHVQPRKPMRWALSAVDTNAPVAIGVEVARHHAGFAHLAATNAPSENTSIWVVIENFAQTLCAKIGISHAVVPLKQWFGQKPGSVSALAGLRHFSALALWSKA